MRTYREAGVDIDRGDRFAAYIGSLRSQAVSRGLGGFAGGIEVDTARYTHPVVLSTTDGVGTKLLVARELGRYDTVGIYLVAMCVNDLIVCNAEPVSFLDYIACGGVDESILHPLMDGIVRGCEEAECSLAGGETAEMPDMYAPGDIDLAGFAVGIGEKGNLLPAAGGISAGDPIYGLPSSGIHSNGLSLARKIITPDRGEDYAKLLLPTRIYIKEMKTLLAAGEITAAAHITGGGLEGNLRRVLPGGLRPELSWDWQEPGIFEKIRKKGSVAEEEMRRVFNLGIGMALVVRKGREETFEETARGAKIDIRRIGVLRNG